MHLLFKELKNLHLSGNLSAANFSKLSIYSYAYTPFCFTDFKNSPLNSLDQYLKLLSDRFLTNESRLDLITWIPSIKTKFY